mgnify:CR=1 FL=1
MTLADFYTRVNYALRGIDEDAPTHGSDEANFWLDTLNRKKDELYNDISKNWRPSYSVESLGAVSASATPTFNLPASFLMLSGDEQRTNGAGGGLYIVTTDDKRVDLEVINPNERRSNTRAAFIADFNPQKVYITTEITADEEIVGGTLYAPGYYMPDDIEDETDVLPFLDPNWAVMSVASEVAFADITYEDKAPDLNAKANDLYKKMVAMNRAQLHNNPQPVKYNMKRIGARLK